MLPVPVPVLIPVPGPEEAVAGIGKMPERRGRAAARVGNACEAEWERAVVALLALGAAAAPPLTEVGLSAEAAAAATAAADDKPECRCKCLRT